MSSANLASLNNNKAAQAPASRGAGPAGTTAPVTAVVVKDQVLPTVVAIAQPVHNGGFVPHAYAAIAPTPGVVNTYGK